MIKEDITTEKDADIWAARFCFAYLMLVLGLLFWLLFDAWIGRYTLVRLLGYTSTAELNAIISNPYFRLIIFTTLGGGLGGVVNGLRSVLDWHTKGEFKSRYVWKYIAAPWLGMALALFVFALTRSSLAVFGGSSASSMDSPSELDPTQIFSMFAIGLLAGYGARDVFVWLDDRVSKMFAIPKTGEAAAATPVPPRVESGKAPTAKNDTSSSEASPNEAFVGNMPSEATEATAVASTIVTPTAVTPNSNTPATETAVPAPTPVVNGPQG